MEPIAFSAEDWVALIEKLVRGLDRGSRQWTLARKKQSLQRVLDGSRSDAQRLLQRLGQLLLAWDDGSDDAGALAPVSPVSTGTVQVGDAPASAQVPAPAPGLAAIPAPGLAATPAAGLDAVPAPEPAAAPAPALAATPAPALAATPAPELASEPAPAAAAAPSPGLDATPAPGPAATPTSTPAAAQNQVKDAQPLIIDALARGLCAGLPPDEPRAAELADELAALAARIHTEGGTPAVVHSVAQACARAQRLFEHRHHLVDELLLLCRSLSAGLTELAEDGSWVQGQSDNLRARLDESTSARSVRAARDMLDQTRRQQHELRAERERSRDALKSMVRQMLTELGELGSVTGRFNEHIERYAGAIEHAPTLDSLAGLVGEMVGETRAVHAVVAGARERMAAEHARAGELESRVSALEGELRRLSDEVSTDALTQVANRRGLAAAFEVERARAERDGASLAVGLIDIDNFKRLNDSLGHAAGDVALKALVARVKQALRPVDHVARFGGEEFVLLLPGTPLDEAQRVLTRLQRELSASLFIHDGREIFVTFSGGVTAHRAGQALELALERADEGLYEAKRSGKNRTCVR